MSERKRVFISYSRKDYWDETRKCVIPDNVVLQVKNALEEKGVSPWFDEQCIYHDTGFMTQIAHAIEKADIFLFISTENSNASSWVQRELALAVDQKKIIMPLKVVEKYPAEIGIWVAGIDYEDYFQKRSAAIPSLVNKVIKELNRIDEEVKIDETKSKATVQEKLQNEADKLSKELVDFEICLVQLNEELEKLEREKELLLSRILLQRTSKQLIETEKKDREQKLSVVREKLNEKNDMVDSAEEVDLETIEPCSPITPQELTSLKNGEDSLIDQSSMGAQGDDGSDAVVDADSVTTKETDDYSFLCGYMDILKKGNDEVSVS